MARLLTCGYEWSADRGDSAPQSFSSYMDGSTSAARTGTYGRRSGTNNSEFLVPGAVTGRTYFHRVYVRTSGSPASVTEVIFVDDSSLNGFGVRLQTDRTLRLASRTLSGGWVDQGSASAVLAVDTWYRVELSVNHAAAGNDSAEFRLDGTQIATASVAVSAGAPNRVFIGQSGSPSVNVDQDDYACNDDQGANQNSWPGEGKVVLLYPIGDSQSGTWVGAGTGDELNLSDAMDNRPPTGQGNATATDADQNETNDSSGDNTSDELRVSLLDYTMAGIGPRDAITVVHPLVCHGEQVNTGTKTGKFGLVSNPANTNGGGETSFTYGDNSGAVVSWGSSDTSGTWRNLQGAPVYDPFPVLGNAPVIAIRKTDTGTRWVVTCEIGAYVEYIPTKSFPPFRRTNPLIYR